MKSNKSKKKVVKKPAKGKKIAGAGGNGKQRKPSYA